MCPSSRASTKCINGFVIIAGDYDNDGFQDLFVTRLGFYYGDCALYHNNGDGTFTDVTEKAGRARAGGRLIRASWVDYDCDGHLDLFIAYNLGGMFDRTLQNRLFHNNGDGTFTDVTEEAGLAEHLHDHRLVLGRLQQRRLSRPVPVERAGPPAVVPQQWRRHVH